MSSSLSQTLSCGHCANISPMKIIGHVYKPEHDLGSDDEPPTDQGTTYLILECPACKLDNIVSNYWHEYMDSEDVTYKVLYPISKSNIPVGLPSQIESTLAAAEKVKTIDVNAYVILLRRLLELVCIDRKAKSGTLAQMLTDLAAKGEIPDKLVLVATGLKNFGNIGAHAGMGELTNKEIPIVKALTLAILEYIYSAPFLANQAEAKLKDIKLNGNKANR